MLSATLLYLVVAYLVSSSWESWAHRNVLHASKRSRRAWRTYGAAGKLLQLAYFYHNTIHHRRTFVKSFFVQFDDQFQKRRLDESLKGSIREQLAANGYGVTISGFWELFTFAAIPMVFISVGFVFLAPAWLPVGIFIALLPLILTRYLHPLLHIDPEQHRPGSLVSLICRTPIFLHIQRYHFVHHKYGLVNFNLLPGADWAFNVGRRVSSDELLHRGADPMKQDAHPVSRLSPAPRTARSRHAPWWRLRG